MLNIETAAETLIITTGDAVLYLLVGVVFQTINPAVSNAIAELFFLSVQNVLKTHKRSELLIYHHVSLCFHCVI